MAKGFQVNEMILAEFAEGLRGYTESEIRYAMNTLREKPLQRFEVLSALVGVCKTESHYRQRAATTEALIVEQKQLRITSEVPLRITGTVEASEQKERNDSDDWQSNRDKWIETLGGEK